MPGKITESGLIMLNPNYLDNKKGLLRKHLSVRDEKVTTVLPKIKDETPTYNSRKSIKFIDAENEKVIEKCRESIKDNKIYAETILVNARTGK